VIFSYDKINDHKIPVTKCTISTDRKAKKDNCIVYLNETTRAYIYVTEKNFDTNSRRKVQNLRIKFTKLRL